MRPFLATAIVFSAVTSFAEESNRFEYVDVFQLEYASDPQISPDGTRTVYVRNSMDVMEDRRRSELWLVSADGNDHRRLTAGSPPAPETNPHLAGHRTEQGSPMSRARRDLRKFSSAG